MIIRSIFGRYGKRWSPVHPTHGAFWGVGVGIGCGVGWGPGFGPEVVGYVGSGCGVGFSVGITFLGFGIGLPATSVVEIPQNAFMMVGRGAMGVARAGYMHRERSRFEDGWGDMNTVMSNDRSSLGSLFSSFKVANWSEKSVDLLVSRAKFAISESMRRIGFGSGT